MRSYLLHSLLVAAKLPLDELSMAHLVAMEVPSNATLGFERLLLRLVQQTRAAGPQVAVIVAPQLRRQAQTMTWVNRWNRMEHAPFQFHRTCSCCLGDSVPGLHGSIYLGRSFGSNGDYASCAAVPTTGMTPQALNRMLAGVLGSLLPVPWELAACDSETVRHCAHSAPEPRCLPAPAQRVPDSSLDGLTNEKSQEIAAAFPTDSKERERNAKNLRKAQGLEAKEKKKKTFVIEDHYDDCGDDLSSLGPDVLLVGCREPYCLDSDEELIDHDFDIDVYWATAYPTYPIDPTTIAKPSMDGWPMPGRDPRAKPPKESSCPSCRGFRAREDWDHNRIIGECSYPHDEGHLPDCLACQKRRARWEDGHSYEAGHCRFASIRSRARTTGTKRSVPHEAKAKHDSEPTAGLPSHIDGRELGQNGEEAIAREDELEATLRASRAEATAKQIADADLGTGGAGGSGHQPYDEPNAEEPPAAPAQAAGEGGHPEPGERRGRGPDQEPRVRRQYQDAGAGPEQATDWTNFDIGRVVRVLRTDRIGDIRLTLRKLHVRWWHASHNSMKRMLERCGVADHVLQMLPEITQTCKICREWARPGPSNASNIEVADTFNAQVEGDLIFIHKHIIFHMIDRCTRWHAAKLVTGKTEEDCMAAIDELWISTHGAPKEFICDGESGIARSEQCKRFLARKGVSLHVRGKDQHARFIERRGALLRDCVHRIEGQLKEEGLEMPFHSILAEATFCGNALLAVNGSTPYNAVYGRVPNILPSIDQINPPDAERDPLLVRHSHRLRGNKCAGNC